MSQPRVRLGRPTHMVALRRNVTACGFVGCNLLTTRDPKEVDCCNCLRVLAKHKRDAVRAALPVSTSTTKKFHQNQKDTDVFDKNLQ